MSTNPDPARITEPMWKLWENRPNPVWLLSGIYADKKGYHNTVIANKKKWPGNYTIKLPLDLVKINNDKARALDQTMTESEMIKWTRNMKTSAENPLDTRLGAVKEFYGTLDGKTVFGLSKDTVDGSWERSSADLTHLWHGHISIFTAFVNDWDMLSPILSVEAGDTFDEWRYNTMSLPKLGDSGEDVKYWQIVHNLVKGTVEPASPSIPMDGDYGPTTQSAFKDFWVKSGGIKTFTATYLPGWLASKYHIALANVSVPSPVHPPVLDDAQLKALVDAWLVEHVNQELTIQGRIEGKVVL